LGRGGKSALGFTPEGLINEIRRNAHYTAADFLRVASTPPVDAGAVMRRLREALAEAEAFVARMPTDKIGLLFFKDGKIVQPVGRVGAEGVTRHLGDSWRRIVIRPTVPYYSHYRSEDAFDQEPESEPLINH
jgi:hypothetical protein